MFVKHQPHMVSLKQLLEKTVVLYGRYFFHFGHFKNVHFEKYATNVGKHIFRTRYPVKISSYPNDVHCIKMTAYSLSDKNKNPSGAFYAQKCCIKVAKVARSSHLHHLYCIYAFTRFTRNMVLQRMLTNAYT